MKLSTTKQNASTDVVVSLVEKQIFLEVTKYFLYSPCRGWNCCPPWCGWCCRLWTGWRCCCCPPPRAHSCHHHARLSPSLSASCLSNMRCTGDRSCRIAHVPENRYRQIQILQIIKNISGISIGQETCLLCNLFRCSFQWEQLEVKYV